MIIQHSSNDSIWDLDASIRINPVNTQGIMGAGIAKEFKQRYPEMFNAYKKACDTGLLRAGGLHMYNKEPDLVIVNFATKGKWHKPSKLEYIDAGLQQLMFIMARVRMQEVIAIPALGCGLDELGWPLIREKLIWWLDVNNDQCPWHQFHIYPPHFEGKGIIHDTR